MAKKKNTDTTNDRLMSVGDNIRTTDTDQVVRQGVVAGHRVIRQDGEVASVQVCFGSPSAEWVDLGPSPEYELLDLEPSPDETLDPATDTDGDPIDPA